MTEMIAYCGLDCLRCGALIATRENDDAKRREVAAQWSKEFKADIKPGDIQCHGCTTKSEVLFTHCRVCEIRKCGQEKGFANCAHCEDYACERLSGFLTAVPEAKARLDSIRSDLGFVD